MGPANQQPSKAAGAGSWMALAGLCTAVVLAAKEVVKRRTRPRVNLAGKVAVITGGSRGLGLAIAREFGMHGAQLALCARDQSELDDACARLAEVGIQADPFAVDLRDSAAIQPLVDRLLSKFGRIDILVNDAGSISVGPLASFSHADFEEAMNLMFWAPVDLTLAVLPHMKQSGGGHVVNVTSVGGRVSVPHLLPYSCAKFAFAGFSTGLSAEVGADDIHVLTVIPGLMRTGSYLNAEFKGAAKEEFAWFALLGNLPGFSVAADYAARRVRESLQSRNRVCTISLPAKILIACEALAPETTRTIMEFVNGYMLPESGSKEPRRGKALNPALNALFQSLTVLGRRAAHDLNQ